jgi:type VI protein secretion system component VasK
MRLFYKGTAVTLDEIKYTFVWAVNVMQRGQPVKVEGEVELTAKDKVNPFKSGFFSQFKCPQGVGP